MQLDSAGTAQLLGGLGRRHPRIAVATVVRGETTTASSGVPADADFEIGSISKAITGLLYADACDRGEVRPSTALGEMLPLADCPAAHLTLAAVSTHASGLPRLPQAGDTWKRTYGLWRHGRNPYGETLAELLLQARTVRLKSPRPRYSNLGFELLGHAVAAGAGLGFQGLLADRLRNPLGLTSMYVPAAAGELGPHALSGTSRRGSALQPWVGEALGPAGGILATIGDLAALARALLDGSAPGTSALDPVANFAGPAARIGAGWMTLEAKGRTITWHNGATGGFCSWMGLDRDAGTGVVLLSAVSGSLDRHAFRILTGLTSQG
ncbi:CubicO group peptidase (beta-lactamase class C family) [Arthrobacter pascens]|uniref:serine hydrolase domain-containing protein n=1 Tax=Arthrobacter pascens TaxID=1677 RepID=UPI00278E37D6|nr:serine hydrolase domain-containing protein [Arthrobacter pascens]MDQ0680439.1 CubicO group peptidase (beta-lactamase class C family) [Arthrobacter pascens]